MATYKTALLNFSLKSALNKKVKRFKYFIISNLC